MREEYKSKYDYEVIEWEEYREKYYTFNFEELEDIIQEPVIFKEKIYSNKTAICIIVNSNNEKRYCNLPYFDQGEYPEKKIVCNVKKLKCNISWMVFDNFKYSEMLKCYKLENEEFVFLARGTIFREHADFSKVKFTGLSSFYSATFTGKANFRKSHFDKKIDFALASFTILIISECEAYNKINLDNLLCLETLSILGFTNYGYLSIKWFYVNRFGHETDIAHCLKKYYTLNKINPNYTELKEQFRFLKENYGQNGQYEEEDKAYYEFKKVERMEMRSQGSNNDGKNKNGRYYFSKWLKIFWSYLLDVTGGYGTKPFNTVATMFAVVVIFWGIFLGLTYLHDSDEDFKNDRAIPEIGVNIESLLQSDANAVDKELDDLITKRSESDSIVQIPLALLLQLQAKSEIQNHKNCDEDTDDLTPWQRAGEALYLSGITFVTVGFGDVCPPPYGKGFAVVEGFLGLFLMSYLTIAFSRKVLR